METYRETTLQQNCMKNKNMTDKLSKVGNNCKMTVKIILFCIFLCNFFTECLTNFKQKVKCSHLLGAQIDIKTSVLTTQQKPTKRKYQKNYIFKWFFIP